MSKTDIEFINSFSFDDEINISEVVEEKAGSNILDYENLINSIYSVCTFSKEGFISYKNVNFRNNLNRFLMHDSIYTFFGKAQLKEIFGYLQNEDKWFGQVQLEDHKKELYILNCQIVRIEDSNLDEYIFLSSEITKL